MESICWSFWAIDLTLILYYDQMSTKEKTPNNFCMLKEAINNAVWIFLQQQKIETLRDRASKNKHLTVFSSSLKKYLHILKVVS